MNDPSRADFDAAMKALDLREQPKASLLLDMAKLFQEHRANVVGGVAEQGTGEQSTMIAPEREKIARALCEADEWDPDYLEPGDDPYQNNQPVIDGYNAKGDACHFTWRRYDRIYLPSLIPVLDEIFNQE